MELREALDILERGRKAFLAFEKAHEVVAVAAGLENRVRELQAAVAAEEAKLADAKAEADAQLAAVRASIERAKKQAEKAEAAAREAGKTILAEAEQRARERETEAEAKLRAAEDAQARAFGELAEVDSTVNARRAELADLEQKIALAKAEIARVFGTPVLLTVRDSAGGFNG